MDYPQRPKFFAHRFCRILHKSCAAQDLGHAACYFLTVIAHTEDSARYSGPVRYWNSQLAQTMGFTSPKQLNDCRRRAVDAGWLHYERKSTRSVGLYWVTIPSQFEDFDDGLIEPIHSDNGKDIHSRSGKKPSAIHSDNGGNSGKNNGRNSGKNPGTLSIPNPNPNPCPKEKSGSGDSDFHLEDEVLDAWNAAAKKAGWVVARKLSNPRRAKLRARLKDPDWRSNYKRVLAYLIEHEPWLNGDNKHSWKANMDWFLRPSTVNEYLERAESVGNVRRKTEQERLEDIVS